MLSRLSGKPFAAVQFRANAFFNRVKKGLPNVPPRMTMIGYLDTSNMQPGALSFGGVQSRQSWALLAAAATALSM